MCPCIGMPVQSIGPLDGLPIKDIQAAIRNTTGTRPSLFVPEMSFEMLVKKQMKRLLAPGLRCVELVYQELERLVHKCMLCRVLSFKTYTYCLCFSCCDLRLWKSSHSYVCRQIMAASLHIGSKSGYVHLNLALMASSMHVGSRTFSGGSSCSSLLA